VLRKRGVVAWRRKRAVSARSVRWELSLELLGLIGWGERVFRRDLGNGGDDAVTILVSSGKRPGLFPCTRWPLHRPTAVDGGGPVFSRAAA
jgi:hypothetical protein